MITQLIAKYYTLLKSENKVCSRKDYWIFKIIHFIINILILLLGYIFYFFNFSIIFEMILIVISLIVEIIDIILTVKRLHDVNLSGIFFVLPFLFPLLILIPYIDLSLVLGSTLIVYVMIFITLLLPSENYGNKYKNETLK